MECVALHRRSDESFLLLLCLLVLGAKGLICRATLKWVLASSFFEDGFLRKGLACLSEGHLFFVFVPVEFLSRHTVI